MNGRMSALWLTATNAIAQDVVTKPTATMTPVPISVKASWTIVTARSAQAKSDNDAIEINHRARAGVYRTMTMPSADNAGPASVATGFAITMPVVPMTTPAE